MNQLRKISILLLVFIPSISFANTGFICKKMNIEIAREEVNGLTTLVIKNTADGNKEINERVDLPMSDSVDDYQERYATYHIVMEHAHLSFPFMPGPMLVYHITKSTNDYRNGFKAFEGKHEPVELKKMYCEAFMKAILQY